MIRSANIDDCINLAALSLEVWIRTYCVDGIKTENSSYALSTFTENYFKKIIKNKKYKLLIFEEYNYLRGYILINLESKYKNHNFGFEIEKLYVHSSYQGKSIGTKLLEEIKLKFGKIFWLITWNRNKSISFYKKFGFKDIEQYNFNFENEIIKNRVLVYNNHYNK